MSTDKSNFYWISQMESQRDPIRTTHWRFRVNTSKVINAMGNPEALRDIESDKDISVIVKNAEIPKVVTNFADAFFMGQKMGFATNTDFDHESTFEILETSDLIGLRFFGYWHQYVHNVGLLTVDKPDKQAIDPNSDTGMGVNLGAGKFTQDIYPSTVSRNTDWVWLELYDYTQGVVLFRVSYVNFVPKSIGGINIKHEGANLATWSLQSRQDAYNFVIPSKFGSLGKGFDS